MKAKDYVLDEINSLEDHHIEGANFNGLKVIRLMEKYHKHKVEEAIESIDALADKMQINYEEDNYDAGKLEGLYMAKGILKHYL